MIVTCPHCSKRYMIDDGLLSQEGRQVRCITCRHVWWQTAGISSPLKMPPLPGVPEVALKMSASSENKSSWLVLILILTILIALISFLSFGKNFIVKRWPQTEHIYNLIGLHATLPGAGLSVINTISQVKHDGSVEMV